MFAAGHKDPGALLTIGELSQELGVAQHILRYWETKFPQLKPMQRAGNRRYYRASDVELARRINRLLHEEGYTVRGVQKLLRERPAADEPNGSRQPQAMAIPMASASVQADDPPPSTAARVEPRAGVDPSRLAALRDRLSAALDR